jgi:hypothetical protein
MTTQLDFPSDLILDTDDAGGDVDAFEGRDHEFAFSQGIEEPDYSELLELAIAHADAAKVFPNAPAWRFVGPRNLGGRILSLGQDPEDPRMLYAGTAQGGIWRSSDAGDTWERLGGDEHIFPVGAIAVAPMAPNVVYFGTGAPYPLHVSGRGLFRALVGRRPGDPRVIERLVAAPPATTAPNSSPPGAALRYTRIRVDPYDPTRFWAASQSGLWRCECPITQPATPHFTRDLPNSDGKPAKAGVATHLDERGVWPSHCTDLLVAPDPRDTTLVALGKAQVPRYLILYVGIDGTGVFRGRFDRSTGTTAFDDDPLSLPDKPDRFGPVRLALCESQAQHVYAVLAEITQQNLFAKEIAAATAIYHSADNGSHWSKGSQRISHGGDNGQATFNLVLEVAPDDPGVVVLGEVELAISHDFGKTLTQILNSLRFTQGDPAQHADQHAALFDSGDHRKLWVGNDGGVTLARDLRLTPQAAGYWRKRSHGIYAGQCQDVAVHPSFPFLSTIGLQDNGSWVSLGGPTWYLVSSGDGGAAAFDLASARRLFTTNQGGLMRVEPVTPDVPHPLLPYFLQTLVPAGDLPDRMAPGHLVTFRQTRLSAGLTSAAPFLAVIEQHPTAAGQLLAGRVNDGFSSVDGGATWAPLIPAAQLEPTQDAEVSAATFGPPDAHNPDAGAVDGWVGTSEGTLFFTDNAPAGTWNRLGPITPPPGPPPTPPPPPPPPPFRAALPFARVKLRISDIAVHPLDRRIVAVSGTGLQGRVFLTFDQGRRWIDVSEPVPSAMEVLPAGAKLGAIQRLGYTARATYGTTILDVTARAAWASSNEDVAIVATARLLPGEVRAFGFEGAAAARIAGTTTISAQLFRGIATARAAQQLTVTSAATPEVPFQTPPRTIVPGSLPPGPLSSLIFDPAPAAGSAATLLGGTLAGIYALPNVPVIASLKIQPAVATVTFQTGASPFQLRCDATFSDGTQVDITHAVDWSSTKDATASVSNVEPNQGQLTIGAAGDATIRVDRGGKFAELKVHVQAGAAPAPPALDPAPTALAPTVTADWQKYGVGLPHILVTHLERVGATNAIRASTFGLGIFECVTTGAPLQRLSIRQTLIEDGRSDTRPATPALPDDPRLPAGVVALDNTHSFDIRVDAPPFTFFDDVVDGAEFDEQLEAGDPVPAEANYVYVQVHNRGTSSVPDVTVHLYAAACASGDVVNPVGPVATPFPASLDAAAPIADFYGQPDRDPTSTSAWKRIGVAKLAEVPADAPRVVRFTWAPDLSLQDQNVALLALCDAAKDALPNAPAGTKLSTFILGERRAALRIVHVAPRPVASVYIRDGVADDTRIGGYPVGGRSPDIMVLQTDITGTPDEAFKDFISRRPADVITGGTNVVYVRVLNRRRFETKAKVKVFAIHLDDANAPDTTVANWVELPSGAAFADVTVPPAGVGYARIEFPNASDPNAAGTNKTYLLLALVKSEDDTDPLPNKDRVDTADAFWDLVSHYVDSDNAAARAVPWAP